MATAHSDELTRDMVHIALTSGLTRRQIASDLGIGLSTLGKRSRAIFNGTDLAPARSLTLM